MHQVLDEDTPDNITLTIDSLNTASSTEDATLSQGTDWCIKPKENYFDCRDPLVKSWDICFKQCNANRGTCVIQDEVRLPCLSLKLEEEKWKRRVDALETAIENYISIKADPDDERSGTVQY